MQRPISSSDTANKFDLHIFPKLPSYPPIRLSLLHSSLNTASAVADSLCLPPKARPAANPLPSRLFQTDSAVLPAISRRYSPLFLLPAASAASLPPQILANPRCSLHRSQITRVDCAEDNANTRDASPPLPSRGREAAKRTQDRRSGSLQ